MSRIITNVPSMLAQRVLGSQTKSLANSLQRLSTGLRINRGADDPAGLIASESLRSEKTAIASAISNAQRAEQVVNVAEGGLQEISGLLIELQSLVGATANEAGVSAEEKEANQLQIDSILQTIDRVANSTSFNGTKLLNGNFDYTTTGIDSTLLDDVSIQSARLSDTAGATIAVSVDVLTSAQTAAVYLSTQAALDGNGGSLTIEVTGNDGVQQFTFASGSTQASIISAINTFKDALGVSASQATGDVDKVAISSTGFGSTQFARARVLDSQMGSVLSDTNGTGDGTETDVTDEGRDAILTINGTQATTDGLKARVSADGFDVTVNIDGASALNTNTGSGTNTTSFTITGGGADFNLSPQVNLAGKVSLGIETVTTGNLGDAVDGYLSAMKSGGTANVVNGDLSLAQSIVDSAVKQVSSLRGRLGAFTKNTVGATIRNLGVTLENTAAAESQIRETDFAVETAELTRLQIISQAATQSLALANAQPQSVLALLG